MEKNYRPYEPDQMLLPPPALQDWLPADHVVFFLSEFARRCQEKAHGKRQMAKCEDRERHRRFIRPVVRFG